MHPLVRASLIMMVSFCTLALLGSAALGQARAPQTPQAGVHGLINWDFECSEGVYTQPRPGRDDENTIHAGWTITVMAVPGYDLAEDGPYLNSTRMQVQRPSNQQNGECAPQPNTHVEKIHGEDSAVVFADDIEYTSEPGKPFDVAWMQQVSATVGTEYSLSGWMLSLCGGSTVPNDCPAGYYMAKMLGIDPLGGLDPRAPSVVWTENRDNFVTPGGERVGWSNLRLSAVASSTASSTVAAGEPTTITVFARVNSPFRWHGNHAFVDALSLVRSPTVTLGALPTTTVALTLPVLWEASLGPDIPSIPNQKYEALVDIEVRPGVSDTWRSLVADGPATGEFVFSPVCVEKTYQFRARVSAEQPEGVDGATPNQRFPGGWGAPVVVYFAREPVSATVPATENPVFLPVILAERGC